MSSELSRLWWSMPWLQRRWDRAVPWFVWVGQVLGETFRPTARLFKNLRLDVALAAATLLVVLYQGENGLPALVLVIEAALVVVLAALGWNLLGAPYRVYARDTGDLQERKAELEEELRQYKWPIDQERKLEEATFAGVSKQFGTELRAIRHKIEVVKATKPQPAYPPGFHLPAARFDQHQNYISQKRPDFYWIIEAAYTAASHVNEHLDGRRGRATPGATIGVIADDGLDEAYEAAGRALDALGEHRDEPWEPVAAKAARRVAEDIVREHEETAGEA